MSPVKKYAIGAGAAVLLSLIFFGAGWITLLVILGVVGAPVAAWFMLDESQRQRLKRVRRRGIGH
ncbi:hypothetical protein [Nonomuraea typhae]|uniref:Uncharacterized protein n=1 Tax=Nonomuraea typhae TaxID=2603600 RepID=A0ABW7Z0N4_9ACTN|nr:hypothetical protein [Nonomuraea typhae]